MNSSSTFYSRVKHFETLSAVTLAPRKIVGQYLPLLRHTLTATDGRLFCVLFEHKVSTEHVKWNEKMIINYGYIRIWKEAPMKCFKLLTKK
jgi:hypothetical protein